MNLGQQTKRIHSFISDFGNIITFLLKTASPRCRFTHCLTCRYSSIIYNSTDLNYLGISSFTIQKYIVNMLATYKLNKYIVCDFIDMTVLGNLSHFDIGSAKSNLHWLRPGQVRYWITCFILANISFRCVCSPSLSLISYRILF